LDYTAQVQKAINYVETRLHKAIDLEDLADVANFSMFHFHRMFLTITGLTPKAYIRSRRFNEAAKELTFSQNSISEIARKYQFESQASFTRAFGKHFGISPGKLRRTKFAYPTFLPINVNQRLKKFGGFTMEAKIVSKEAIKVIGMSVRTTQKENTIPQLWNRFNPLACSIKNQVVPGVALGICPHTDMKDFNEETEFEYIAGMEVTSLTDIPEGMLSYEVPAQRYAVFTHKGSLETLGDTYKAIYSDWFAKNDYEFKPGAEFELYDERFKFGAEDSEMDIYVPIK